MKLSKRTVDALQKGEKQYIVFDETLPGFGVRVLTTGRKTFHYQYRAGGRTRRVKLGVFGSITVDDARNEARKVAGAVARKEDPAEQIEQERRAPTMAKVCDRFMTDYVAVKCKPSTKAEYQRSVDLFIKPEFGTHKVQNITRADVSDLHHRMRNISYQANRTLGVLSKLFNLCEVWGLRPDGSNPCRHVQRYREEKKERFLSGEELSRLGAVLDEAERTGTESKAVVNAIRLLVLTGCRLREIQTLKWEYVKPPYIELPDSKTGARRIPLDDAALGVLKGIERIPDNPYVITGIVEEHHLTDLQKPWRRIRKSAGLEDVRIHDLRHTYASNALANGLPIEMVGKLLGHTQIQTTMRYAHLADDPVRQAAKLVSSGLSAALSAPQKEAPAQSASNVVSLSSRRKAT